jgi:hypothetical protein
MLYGAEYAETCLWRVAREEYHLHGLLLREEFVKTKKSLDEWKCNTFTQW